MNVTRRRVLQAGLAAAAAGLGLGAVGYLARRPRVYSKADVINHLLEAFASLHPDRDGTSQFVDLYLQHYNPLPPSNSMPFVERTFLMSTDFFPAGQPPNGPVRFVQLYHPYVSPCYNPMALAEADS